MVECLAVVSVAFDELFLRVLSFFLFIFLFYIYIYIFYAYYFSRILICLKSTHIYVAIICR